MKNIDRPNCSSVIVYHNNIQYSITNDGFAVLVDAKKCTDPDIVIPEMVDNCQVRSIGRESFYMMDSVKSVCLPKGIVEIQKAAFWLCENLENINFPRGILSIGSEAFYGCGSIVSINIPESVVHIGENPFQYCSSLRRIYVSYLSQCYITIGNVLFSQHGKQLISYPGGIEVDHYAIPLGVESVSAFAFTGAQVKSVSIPDTVKYIQEMAFSDCEHLHKVFFGHGLQRIDKGAFSDCASLRQIKLPEGLITIEDNAFENCKMLELVCFPDSLQKIGDNAFWNTCISSLGEDSVFPRSLTSIGNYAFGDRGFHTDIFFHEGIVTIGDSAFGVSKSGIRISLPRSIQYIGTNAFGLDSTRSHDYWDPAFCVWEGSNADLYIRSNNLRRADEDTFVCDDYLFEIDEEGNAAIVGWHGNETDIEIPCHLNGCAVTSISPGAFSRSKLVSIKLPVSCHRICKQAFKFCSKLVTVIIPNSVTHIDDQAFYKCSPDLTFDTNDDAYAASYARNHQFHLCR